MQHEHEIEVYNDGRYRIVRHPLWSVGVQRYFVYERQSILLGLIKWWDFRGWHPTLEDARYDIKMLRQGY